MDAAREDVPRTGIEEENTGDRWRVRTRHGVTDKGCAKRKKKWVYGLKYHYYYYDFRFVLIIF